MTIGPSLVSQRPRPSTFSKLRVAGVAGVAALKSLTFSVWHLLHRGAEVWQSGITHQLIDP
jgi:hypothetical protein